MFDKSNPPIGLVGYAKAKGLFEWLQYQIAGPGSSHSFLTTFPIGKFTEVPMVFEADMTVTHTPYEKYLNDSSRDFYLYMVNNASYNDTAYSLERCTREFSGVRYGFFQLLWFPYRWLMETIFRRDMRKSKNWFTNGIICSELWWWYLWYMTENNPSRWMKLRSILSEWNPDVIQSYDIKLILQRNPDIFLPFAEYVNGKYKQIMHF